jgi:hypothetical protein
MKHRMRYLLIAVGSGLRHLPWWGMFVMSLLLVGWIVGLVLLPGPADPVVQALSILVVVGVIGVIFWANAVTDLRTKYSPGVLLGGALCIILSAFCLSREFSLGLLVRLSLPLLFLALIAFYLFYFSVFWGKQRISKLRVGERFPEFALSDSAGKTVTLASMLEKGPALLTFYKGDW